MISKLKKKFTILASVSMLLLMTALVLIMNIVNYTSVVKEVDTILDVLAQSDSHFDDDITPPEKPDNRFDDFMPRDMSPEVPYESRYFSVTVSADGVIRESNLNNIVSVDSSSVEEYINEAISNNASRGFIGQFRFYRQPANGNIKILFLDAGRKLDAFTSFLWTSLAVGLFGCIVAFLLFMSVSGKIVKPIAESYEKQKRFISDAGHEIKTPLTIINANVDLLECDGEKEELTEIKNQANRLAKLTNNLVFLSKLEETENKIKKIEMPLSDIVAETANSFKAVAAGKSIRFTDSIAENISINGSPDEIRQLISTLLENAVKYAPENGFIRISLIALKKSARLIVTNNTAGTVDTDDLPHVFDRFYRTDKSRNSSTGGHGIGLSIAKAIVENHSGKIWAQSSNPTEFTITAEIPF